MKLAAGLLPPLTQTALSGRRLEYALLWLSFALSSYVAIEPAPFDVLIAALMPLSLLLGLRLPAGFSVPFLAVTAMLLSACVSALFAGGPSEALRDIAIGGHLLLTFAFLTAIIHREPEHAIHVIMSGYTLAALIATLVGALGYFGLVPNAADYLFAGRAKGFFKDPNVFGPFLAPPALYLLARLSAYRGWRALALLGLFLILVLGVLISFSRGAWANLALSIVLFGALAHVMARRNAATGRLILLIGAAMLLAAFVIGFALSLPQISGLFETRAALFQSYDTGTGGRFYMQSMALHEILEHPFGIGPGLWHSLYVTDPHNVYLKVPASNGWLAGLGYFALVAATLVQGFRFCRQEGSGQLLYIALYASFVATALQGVQIDTDHWRHFHVLLALVWGPALEPFVTIWKRSGGAILR